jgi:alkylated DNA nucleotide flippase Atl1
MQMMGVGEGHRKAVLRRLARDARVARIVAWVRAIPEGYVRTYGDIEPRAPRLVGHVLATTHDLPWHRTLGS